MTLTTTQVAALRREFPPISPSAILAAYPLGPRKVRIGPIAQRYYEQREGLELTQRSIAQLRRTKARLLAELAADGKAIS